ncbi:hypothetical protein BC941DRAFT_416325 [Chlamydoabsidia padenii]|nr:hypothetical protein BC941DRAFT_416325 [Chlamydoabsidia padenii]
MSDSSSSTTQPKASSSSAPPPPQRHSIRTIPPLVLLSFAVIHSQVYWLYSVFYHLCHNLPDRSLDPSLNDTVRNALTKGTGGRARAFSEPQQASAMILQRRQTTLASGTRTTNTTKIRPRSNIPHVLIVYVLGTTISAKTVDADGHLRRQQWVQHVHACLDEQEESIKKECLQQTVTMDERLGRTRPPRWWQRTKRHLLTRQDNNNDEESDSSNMDHSNITSTLSLPAATSTVRTSLDSAATTLLGGAFNGNQSSRRPSQSVSPPSYDIQRQDTSAIAITDTTIVDPPHVTSSSPSSDNSSASSVLSSLSTKATMSIHGPKSTIKNYPLCFEQQPLQQQQPQQRRPLAKIRSVFVKSQIEPEKSRDGRRKTILGIPSRWSEKTTIGTHQGTAPIDFFSTTAKKSLILFLTKLETQINGVKVDWLFGPINR